MEKKHPLDNLAEIAATCQQCRLHDERKCVVFGRGPYDAQLMIVGDAPTKEEEAHGLPFVEGHLATLNTLFAYSGVQPDRVYLTNLLQCNPRGRFPEDACPEICVPYLKKKIEHIKPLVVILAGRQALRYLLLANTGLPYEQIPMWLGKHIRRRDTYGDTRFAVMFHPAQLNKTKSPDDEELCVATLKEAWDFSEARRLGKTPPATIELQDIQTEPPKLWQSRSLFR